MATALKLKNDIKKLKAAISSKATPKSFVPKLKAQLDKAENELASLKKGGRPRKTSTTKGTATTLSALQKLIQKKKFGVYQGAGVDLKKDAGEGALATGRRVSKGLKSNQWGDASDNKGNVYYEYRPNRLDVKQPKKKQTYPKLERGGYADGGKVKKYAIVDEKTDRIYIKDTNKEFINLKYKELKEIYPNEKLSIVEFASGGYMAEGGDIKNQYDGMSPKEVWNSWTFEQKKHFLLDHKDHRYSPVGLDKKQRIEVAQEYSWNDLPANIKLSVSDHVEDGQYAKGGKLESGVYRIGKPNKVSQNLYEQKIVEIFDNGDISTASDYGRKMSDFRSNTYPIISKEQLEAQYKMAYGGYMAKGGETVPYIIWVSKDGEKREFYGDYKSQRAAEMAMNKLWEKGEYNSMGNKPKSSYEKNGLYAKGGYMAGGGEMHKADHFKDGGEVFSEKKLKEILDEALGHFYQGLNQVDLAMRYLEVKGQGGLKKPLSNKLKLDDLKESIEKIDEYISK
jgi:hypothetical protein